MVRASALISPILTIFWTQHAFAHASDSGLRQLLPTDYYIAGGTMAVALSVLVIALAPHSLAQRLFRPFLVGEIPIPRLEIATSLCALVTALALIVTGFFGTHDPLENLLPLTIWTLWWVALPLFCAVIGNLWALLNPWSGFFALLERRTGYTRLIPLPRCLGYTPAILSFLAFAWFELIYPSPEDPERLAYIVSAYIAGTFCLGAVFGWRDWFTRGECFSVFFHFISRVAPVQWRRSETHLSVSIGFPGFAVIHGPAIALSGALFILLSLSTVSFDGLSKTFWWLDLTGVNPLEFPGRSAVMGVNTAGLLAAWGLLTAAFLVCLQVGRRHLVDNSGITGALALSILPISLAYHFSHYLTALLANGQYALAAIQRALNLPEHIVTMSFLNIPSSVETLWRVQSGGIVMGHIIAVLLAHAIISRHTRTATLATQAGAPLAILMIGYTAFGLWLLASPTGA